MNQPSTKQPEIIVLRLQSAPGSYLAPPERRLARLLKCMLRGYGWRCVSCQPEAPAEHQHREPAVSKSRLP